MDEGLPALVVLLKVLEVTSRASTANVTAHGLVRVRRHDDHGGGLAEALAHICVLRAEGPAVEGEEDGLALEVGEGEGMVAARGA